MFNSLQPKQFFRIIYTKKGVMHHQDALQQKRGFNLHILTFFQKKTNGCIGCVIQRCKKFKKNLWMQQPIQNLSLKYVVFCQFSQNGPTPIIPLENLLGSGLIVVPQPKFIFIICLLHKSSLLNLPPIGKFLLA